MTLLNEGLNRIRTLVATDIAQGQVGSGTALPAASDTDLITPIASTLDGVTSVTANSDKTVNIQFTVPSTVANGSAVNEFQIKLSDANSILRKVHETIDKNDTKEIRYFTSLFVGQRK